MTPSRSKTPVLPPKLPLGRSKSSVSKIPDGRSKSSVSKIPVGIPNSPITWLNAALTVPAGLSLWSAIRHGLERGQDLQWSGAHLAGLGIDPYRQFLTGDPGHRILLAQVPNYLGELYLLLLPLGALPFATARALWLVVNLLLLAAIVLALRKTYALGNPQTLLLLLLTVASAPFRIVLGNGQQSLLELLLFCLVFLLRGAAGQGTALGLSYAKYSFAPVLVLYLLLKRRFGLLLISSVPVLAGLACLWALVGGSLPALALEPFAVSRTGVTVGLGDVMSLVWAAGQVRVPGPAEGMLMYTIALALSVACALYANKRSRQFGNEIRASQTSDEIRAGQSGDEIRASQSGETTAAAMLAVASLLCFTHLTYDYVFLAVPLAAGLTPDARPGPRAAAWTVGIFWALLTASGRVPDSAIPLLQISVFCTLAAIFLLLGAPLAAASANETPAEAA